MIVLMEVPEAGAGSEIDWDPPGLEADAWLRKMCGYYGLDEDWHDEHVYYSMSYPWVSFDVAKWLIIQETHNQRCWEMFWQWFLTAEDIADAISAESINADWIMWFLRWYDDWYYDNYYILDPYWAPPYEDERAPIGPPAPGPCDDGTMGPPAPDEW